MNKTTTDVIIVGGGPVGVYLACLLAQQNITCRIFEKRIKPSLHSRSIGIHPPALRSLNSVGIANEIIAKSSPITQGTVYHGRRKIGTLSLESCPPPYPFVLSIPQYLTEACLEERLAQMNPNVLVRGATLVAASSGPDGVAATVRHQENTTQYHARFLVGCDGVRSTTRELMDIEFPGTAYSDHYLMADFEDNTTFGSDAALFLGSEGVVESFPLPGGSRRWVAWVRTALQDPPPERFTQTIKDRTGLDVNAATCTMISAFTPANFQASRMVEGNILLAGDAAHVISPIGGQGMNLGWLDAEHASNAIAGSLKNHRSTESLFSDYSRVRKVAATKAKRRAEFNMWMGRPCHSVGLRSVVTRCILTPPFNQVFARRFTMQGL